MTISSISLQFDAGISDGHETAREFIAESSHHLGKLQKTIAADMDIQPSQLSRKFCQPPGDTARFTLDDAEKYMEVTGDTRVIFYWIEKFIQEKRIGKAQVEAEIERLQGLLK